MIKNILILLSLHLALLGNSQAASDVSFAIRNFGINVDGSFKNVDIIAEFNTNKELIDLSGKIKVSSIDTGIKSRDEHLLKKDYFDNKKYPEITLTSSTLSKVDQTNYSAMVTLTLKGISKTFTIPIKVKFKDKKITITSLFEINRKDFKVGGGSLVMGKTVKIKVTHTKNL